MDFGGVLVDFGAGIYPKNDPLMDFGRLNAVRSVLYAFFGVLVGDFGRGCTLGIFLERATLGVFTSF